MQSPLADSAEFSAEQETPLWDKPEASMGKEVKIGLAVLGLLLVVFGGMMVQKLVGPHLAATPTGDIPNAEAVFEPQTPAVDEPATLVARREEAGMPHAATPPQAWNQSPFGQSNDIAPEADAPSPFGSGVPTPAERYPTPAERYPTPAQPESFEPLGSGPLEQQQEPTPFSPAPLDNEPVELLFEVDDEPAPLSPVDSGPLEPTPAAPPPRKNPLRQTSAEFPIDDDPLSTPERSDEPGSLTAPPAWGNSADGNSAWDDRASQPLSTPEPRQSAAQDPWGAAPSTPRAEPRASWPPADTVRSPQPMPTTPPANGKYTVGPNDNLWTVSEKVYGTGNYFKALAEHNKFNLPRPDRLQVGTVVMVPPIEELEEKFPALCPKRRQSALVQPRTLPASTRQVPRGENAYIVEEGDTLFDIARYELGKASRWAEIYELNRDLLGEDFNFLRPGIELAMPPKTSADPITRQPANPWR